MLSVGSTFFKLHIIRLLSQVVTARRQPFITRQYEFTPASPQLADNQHPAGPITGLSSPSLHIPRPCLSRQPSFESLSTCLLSNNSYWSSFPATGLRSSLQNLNLEGMQSPFPASHFELVELTLSGFGNAIISLKSKISPTINPISLSSH